MTLGRRLLHPFEGRRGIGSAALACRQQLRQGKLRDGIAKTGSLAQPLPGPAPVDRRQTRAMRCTEPAQCRQMIGLGRRLEIDQPQWSPGEQQRAAALEAKFRIARRGGQGRVTGCRLGPIV